MDPILCAWSQSTSPIVCDDNLTSFQHLYSETCPQRNHTRAKTFFSLQQAGSVSNSYLRLDPRDCKTFPRRQDSVVSNFRLRQVSVVLNFRLRQVSVVPNFRLRQVSLYSQDVSFAEFGSAIFSTLSKMTVPPRRNISGVKGTLRKYTHTPASVCLPIRILLPLETQDLVLLFVSSRYSHSSIRRGQNV